MQDPATLETMLLEAAPTAAARRRRLSEASRVVELSATTRASAAASW